MPSQMKYADKLKDKRIVIFGGTSGLGYAVACAALESRASVIISSSQPTRVESAIASLESAYPFAAAKITGHACDLSTPDLETNISAFFSQIAGDGKIDHIVFTAGDALILDDIHSISYERVLRAGQVRFFAPLFVAKVGARYLSPGPQSSITLTAGTLIQKPRLGWTVPASYAAGMLGMVRSLAVDLRPVRVNLVSPGPVDTEMWNQGSEEQVGATRKAIGAELMTGMAGRPEDVAETYMCCVRDNNMTGANIYTDGGWPLASAEGGIKGEHLAS